MTLPLPARGRVLLRWWFPRAATPNCARCAAAVRAQWDDLAAAGVDVAGMSLDAQDRLDAWAAELRLPYPLHSAGLDDAAADGALRAVGDPWRDVLAARIAVLVDDRGTVLTRWPITDPLRFADEVRARTTMIGKVT